jgi:hypothetical protein
MAVLMAAYEDRPMDLADASLIVLAERLGAKRIFASSSFSRGPVEGGGMGLAGFRHNAWDQIAHGPPIAA